MSSSYNNLSNHDPTQESASMFDLPCSFRGVSGNRTDFEDHLKIIEIKKTRLRALNAMSKSQTILAEIDITIAEYELKLEFNKQRKPKPHHGSRRSKNTQQSNKASKEPHSSEINTGSEQLESEKDAISHQNTSKHNLKSPNKVLKMNDASPKPQKRSEKDSSVKKKTQNDPKKESIMCSIPLNKIAHMQNISATGKHIISTCLSQQQNSDTHNTVSNFTADTSNIVTSMPNQHSESYHIPQTCRDNMSIDLGFQQDSHALSTEWADNFNSTFKPKDHICISTLRVTHSFNFSILPRCVLRNQSAYYCVEGDHVSTRNRFTGGKKMAAFKNNRLLTICSDGGHSGDDDQLFDIIDVNAG